MFSVRVIEVKRLKNCKNLTAANVIETEEELDV